MAVLHYCGFIISVLSPSKAKTGATCPVFDPVFQKKKDMDQIDNEWVMNEYHPDWEWKISGLKTLQPLRKDLK